MVECLSASRDYSDQNANDVDLSTGVHALFYGCFSFSFLTVASKARCAVMRSRGTQEIIGCRANRLRCRHKNSMLPLMHNSAVMHVHQLCGHVSRHLGELEAPGHAGPGELRLLGNC